MGALEPLHTAACVPKSNDTVSVKVPYCSFKKLVKYHVKTKDKNGLKVQWVVDYVELAVNTSISSNENNTLDVHKVSHICRWYSKLSLCF